MYPVGDHTLSELQIIAEKHNEGSIFRFFDKTISYGGRDLLKAMIRTPKTSLSETRDVQKLIRTISYNISLWQVDLSHAYIAAAENYYSSNIAHTMSQDLIQHWFQTMVFSYRNPAEFNHLQSGISATLRVLKALQTTISRLKTYDMPQEISEVFESLSLFLNTPLLRIHLRDNDLNPSRSATFHLDHYFRKQNKGALRMALDIYYKMDALQAIAKTSVEYNLCFPEFDTQQTCFAVTDVWHPLITNSTKNSFSLDKSPRISIITGANTSGKTTFLKSCGVVIYLAHLGWPVPAGYVRLPFLDHLFTSIHLTDDIDLGYSHFYNEVMRIKEIALALHRGERCFVIVDEMFRGTNPQDAVLCSETVLNGFANFKTSTFIVSTHIMELIERYLTSPLICFHCFRTKIVGSDFENTFLLEPGVASEKIGKFILDKAGIVILLNP
jgi:DNA mismatch repair protein MutS